jgi:3-hydroxyacyl-CoA dehydrogenase
MARFEKIGCFGLTEPEIGSGAGGGLLTTAKREGDTWIINGQKKWIGNSPWCDVSIIWARDVADNQVKGFIVENKSTPGFSVAKIENKIALKVVQNGLITLKDCRVPEENRLQAGNSFRDTARVLRMTRYAVGWLSTGAQMGAYENAPERPDFKIKLFAAMDDATPADSFIASSSSSLTMSVIQSKCLRPERCLLGHPFNPPHIIPLVEVVGGAKTSPEAIQRAMAFYASIGKKPILLHKEVPGHVGNRLQSARYREVMYLIEQGVVSVADADDAVSWGPGLRWGVMGPSLQWHVGGGAGGIKHFMDHPMDPMTTGLFKVLGAPAVTPDLKQTITEGVLQEAGNRSVALESTPP